MKPNPDKALTDFIESLSGYEIEESLTLLEILKENLVADKWPEIDSVWDERAGRRCYGKYI